VRATALEAESALAAARAAAARTGHGIDPRRLGDRAAEFEAFAVGALRHELQLPDSLPATIRLALARLRIMEAAAAGSPNRLTVAPFPSTGTSEERAVISLVRNVGGGPLTQLGRVFATRARPLATATVTTDDPAARSGLPPLEAPADWMAADLLGSIWSAPPGAAAPVTDPLLVPRLRIATALRVLECRFLAALLTGQRTDSLASAFGAATGTRLWLDSEARALTGWYDRLPDGSGVLPTTVGLLGGDEVRRDSGAVSSLKSELQVLDAEHADDYDLATLPFDQIAPARHTALQQLTRATIRHAGSEVTLIGLDSIGFVPPGDVTSIGWWRDEPGRIRLELIDGRDAARPIGTFDDDVVRTALAYAADGRPLAAATLEPTRVAARRFLLHPALEDTRVGAGLITSARLAGYFGDRTFGRASGLLRLYHAAWQITQPVPTQSTDEYLQMLARLRAGRDSEQLNRFLKLLREAAERRRELSPEDRQEIVRALVLARFGTDSTRTPLEDFPEFFDPSLAASVLECASQDQDVDEFLSCIKARHSGPPDGGAPGYLGLWVGLERNWSSGAAGDGTPTLAPARPSPWSGAGLDYSHALALGPPGWPEGSVVLWTPAKDGTSPRDAARSSSDVLPDFVLLQRIFRTALDGNLGPAFRPASLVALERDLTRAGWEPHHTPRWVSAYPWELWDVAGEVKSSVQRLRALLGAPSE
jgi:hypothetical protein